MYGGVVDAAGYFENMRFASELTPRLQLDALEPVDLDAVFAIDSDPRTWTHLPRARIVDRRLTEEMLSMVDRSWSEHGLGSWIVRLRHDMALPGLEPEIIPGLEPGMMVGSGGVNLFPAGKHGAFWNLGYRLHPDCWGYGLATELSIYAIRCAQTVRPEAPVIARVLSTNPASVAVAQKAGLRVMWEGEPAEATCKVLDGVQANRIILADRRPSAKVLDWLVSLG